MKHLMYAIDLDTAQIWSRLEGDPAAGSMKIGCPVLEYEKIGEGGDFTKPLTYRLEAMGIEALLHARLKWTRKIPTETKNLHRRFWGMKPLKSALRGPTT